MYYISTYLHNIALCLAIHCLMWLYSQLLAKELNINISFAYLVLNVIGQMSTL